MPDSFRTSTFLPVAIGIAYLLFDAIMPVVLAQLPESLTAIAALMWTKAVVQAELWLLAAWAALGPPPWFTRFAIAIAVAVLAVGLFEYGLIYVTNWGFTPGIGQVFLAPLQLISLTLPLFVMRVWRGWRLASATTMLAESGLRQFSLWQVLVATTLAAAAISFAQLGVAELWGGRDIQQSMLIGYVLTGLIFGSIAVVPLTWLCLGVRLSRAVFWLLFLTLVSNAIAIGLMRASWSGRQLVEGLAGLVFIDIVPLSFSGTLLLLRGLANTALIRAGRPALLTYNV